MPKSATAFRLVDRATKCAPTAASPRAPASQARTALALVMVSSVVNVFDATSTRVRAGSRSRASAAKPVSSTLDRKRARSFGPCARVSASVAMTGPRSEPPMPILTTVSKRSPVAPRSVPSCTLPTKSCICARSCAASALASSAPSGRVAIMRASAGARSAMCIAARCSVGFTTAPANSLWRKPSRSAARARSSKAASVSGPMAVLEKSSVRSSRVAQNACARAGSAAKSGRIAWDWGLAASAARRCQAFERADSSCMS